MQLLAWWGKKSLGQWVGQGLIVLAHLLLLAWILHVLQRGGGLTVFWVTLHFCGMALYGGGLIAFCAYLAKRR